MVLDGIGARVIGVLVQMLLTCTAGCGSGDTMASLAERFPERRVDLERLVDLLLHEAKPAGIDAVTVDQGEPKARLADGRDVDLATAPAAAAASLKGIAEALDRLGASSVAVSDRDGVTVAILMESGGAVGGGLWYLWRENGEPPPPSKDRVERLPGERQWFTLVQ